MSLVRQPADSPRTWPRSSWVLGGWLASSPSVSSLTIRPRGRFFDARFGLAPRGERLQAAEHRGIAARQLEPLPRILGREGEARRVGEPLHFLVEPAAAAGLAQLLDHARENRREMGDVGDRIIDLALVERAAAPVGEARALVEAVAEQRSRSGSNSRPARRSPSAIAAICVSNSGWGTLPVRLWMISRSWPPAWKTFSTSSIVDQQVEQGRQVDAVGLGVDRRRFLGRSAIWIRHRSGQ